MGPKDSSIRGANAASPITGGRGSLGGGLAASVVDTDRVWRDRIRLELNFQRQWKDEYASSSSPASRASSPRSPRMPLTPRTRSGYKDGVNFGGWYEQAKKEDQQQHGANNSNNAAPVAGGSRSSSARSSGRSTPRRCNNDDNRNDETNTITTYNSARSNRSVEEISADTVAELLESTKHQSVGTTASNIDINDITPSDLASLQKKLQKAQYTSTVQASYKFNRGKLLELAASGGHRKQKFHY